MTNAKTSSLTGLKQRRIIGKVAFYVLGLLMAIIVCIPFYWMIITSLKGRGAIMSIPVEWIPKEPTLDAYKKLFAMPEFVGSIFNSFYVSVLCTAVRLLCAAMAAFALTKIPFKGGLTVVRNYLSCGWGRGRCDRKGHAVFLRPRVDSAIMGSASTGISTSSTKLKKISTFCRRLPPDLSGA